MWIVWPNIWIIHTIDTIIDNIPKINFKYGMTGFCDEKSSY